MSAFSPLSEILSLWQKSVRTVSGWGRFGPILAKTLPNPLALSATPKSREVDGFSRGKSRFLQNLAVDQLVADGSRWHVWRQILPILVFICTYSGSTPAARFMPDPSTRTKWGLDRHSAVAIARAHSPIPAKFTLSFRSS
jgi:hypothetical protein